MKRMIYVYEDVRGGNENNLPTVSLTEFLGMLEKSGSHLVEIQTDLPKQEVPSPVLPVFPKTLLELGNLPTYPDTYPLERAVGQLLALGRVTSGQSQSLLKHLPELAQAVGTLRQHLSQIPAALLRRADELVAGKK